MSRLATTSSAGIFVAGLLLFVCWIVAAKDKKLGGAAAGCIEDFHDRMKGIPDSSLKRYQRGNQDAFAYLISFGVICGLLWMGTAALIIINSKYYLFAGIGTTVIFICVFTPMVERIRDGRLCEGSNSGLFENKEKEFKRMEISYELFWGSSMACFLLAAYQIGCAIAIVYEESKSETAHRQMKDAEKNPDGTPANKDELPKEEKKADITDINFVVSTSKIEEPNPAPKSVIVKKGEAKPPAESPLPDVSQHEFSMNEF